MLEVSADIVRPGGFTLTINTSFPNDRVSALFGPSGSGKSTILRLIAGLEHEDGTIIRFNGETWQDGNVFLPPHHRQVGYVFQHLNLFPHLSVDGNLAYAEDRQHRTTGMSRCDIIEILHLQDLLDQPPGQLSGGEQQRVAIARALLSNPQLLVMDEPLGSIDAAAKDRILPYLQRLHMNLEIPVIYVSHSLDEVLYFADTVYTIEAGRITRESSVVEFSVDGIGIHQSEAAAIIRCRVVVTDEDFSLTEVSFEQQTIYISSDKFRPGDDIRVKIPARDVSLSRQRHSSSIINVIETTISSIMDPGDGPTAMVKLSCGEQHLLTRITRKSLKELALRPGEKVFAQIKGVALMTDYER